MVTVLLEANQTKFRRFIKGLYKGAEYKKFKVYINEWISLSSVPRTISTPVISSSSSVNEGELHWIGLDSPIKFKDKKFCAIKH